MTGLVLLEQGDDGVAVGPGFAGERDPCLDCFLRRREASPTPVGELTLGPGGTPDTRDHQVRVAGGAAVAHRFLPLPGCRCPRVRRPAVLWDAVSERVGIVSRVREWRAHGWRHAVARGSRLVGSGGVRVLADGRGAADTDRAARLVAVAEAVERYAAGWWNHSPETRVEDGRVDAVRLTDGAPVAVGAERVFLPYPASAAMQDSVGLAAAESYADAVRRAMAEVIERDTFWAAMEGHAEPDSVAAGPGGLTVVWRAGHGHLVACVATYSDATPHMTLGLGAALTPSEAIAKARREDRLVRGALALPEIGVGAGRFDGLVTRLAGDRAFGAAVSARLSRGSARPEPASDFAAVDLTTADVRAVGIAVARVVRVPAR